MSIKVKPTHFTGTSHVFDRTKYGLAAIIRDILIQSAQTKVWGASLNSFTDSTGGTANPVGSIPAIVFPVAASVPSASLGEAYSSFNTSLGKIENATAVYVATLNKVRGLLGLPILVYPQGAVASANTLAALDLTGAGAAVGSTADYATSVAAMQVVQANVYKLKLALNEVLVAIGQPVEAPGGANTTWPFTTLAAVPACVEDTAGVSSILVTDATAFLASVANDFSSLALMYNDFVPASHTVALTNSTGGARRYGARGQRPAGCGRRRGDDLGSQGRVRYAARGDPERNLLDGVRLQHARHRRGQPCRGRDHRPDWRHGQHDPRSHQLLADGGQRFDRHRRSRRGHGPRGDGHDRQLTLQPGLLRLEAGRQARKCSAARCGRSRRHDQQRPGSSRCNHGGGSRSTGPVTLLNAAVDTWLAGTANNISSIATLLNAMNTMMVTIKPLLVIAG